MVFARASGWGPTLTGDPVSPPVKGPQGCHTQVLRGPNAARSAKKRAGTCSPSARCPSPSTLSTGTLSTRQCSERPCALRFSKTWIYWVAAGGTTTNNHLLFLLLVTRDIQQDHQPLICCISSPV